MSEKLGEVRKKIFLGLENVLPSKIAKKIIMYKPIDQTYWIDIWILLNKYKNQDDEIWKDMIDFIFELGKTIEFNFKELIDDLPDFMPAVSKLTLGWHNFNSKHGYFLDRSFENLKKLVIRNIAPDYSTKIEGFTYVDFGYFRNLPKLNELHLHKCDLALGIGKNNFNGISLIEKLVLEEVLIRSNTITYKKFPSIKEFMMLNCYLVEKSFTISCEQTLKKVVINGALKHLDASGNPILDKNSTSPSIFFDALKNLQLLELINIGNMKIDYDQSRSSGEIRNYEPRVVMDSTINFDFVAFPNLHSAVFDFLFFRENQKFWTMFRNLKQVKLINPPDKVQIVSLSIIRNYFRSLQIIEMIGDGRTIFAEETIKDLKKADILKINIYATGFLNYTNRRYVKKERLEISSPNFEKKMVVNSQIGSQFQNLGENNFESYGNFDQRMETFTPYKDPCLMM
jgi:hypothetical protein